MGPLLIGTDMVLRQRDVTDREGTPQPDATVSITVRDGAGAALAGMQWPQEMDSIGDGDFELDLSFALEATDGSVVVVDGLVELPDGTRRPFRVSAPVRHDAG